MIRVNQCSIEESISEMIHDLDVTLICEFYLSRYIRILLFSL